jgi:hypothetical protein
VSEGLSKPRPAPSTFSATSPTHAARRLRGLRRGPRSCEPGDLPVAERRDLGHLHLHRKATAPALSSLQDQTHHAPVRGSVDVVLLRHRQASIPPLRLTRLCGEWNARALASCWTAPTACALHGVMIARLSIRLFRQDTPVSSGFLRADEGTRTPDPLLTMESRGLAPAEPQSRLPGGLDRITSCRETARDAARYPPIPTVSAPNGHLGVSLAKQCADCRAQRPLHAVAIGAAMRDCEAVGTPWQTTGACPECAEPAGAPPAPPSPAAMLVPQGAQAAATTSSDPSLRLATTV